MTDRAVTVTLDYILMLMIATVLLAGILTISGSLIDAQVSQGVESELGAAGESLAVDLQEVQRLVGATEDDSTSLKHVPALPIHVSGYSYTIAIDDDGSTIVLEAVRPGTSVRVSTATTDVQPTDGSIRSTDVTIVVANGDIEVVAG